MASRAADADATRRLILDAVVAVAADAGIEALTIQAVAAEADVAVRTVYNHFSSRDELVVAALTDLAEQTRADTGSVPSGDRPPRERVLDFVDSYLRSYEQQGRAVEVLMRARELPVVAAAVSEVRAWRRGQLADMLAEADDEGTLQIPLDDAVSIAYAASAHATYATLVHDAGHDPEAARRLVGSMIDRTLFGR